MTETAAADREFVELFRRTAEFAPTDKEYHAYFRFNVQAVDRGRRVVDRLASKHHVQGARALDIGCGTGGMAIALAEAGTTVDAIEPDPLRFSWAQARIAGHGCAATLHDAEAEALPFPDATFGIVTLDSVIEHVADPARTIREVARVLAPGGIAYITWPNKLSLWNIVRDPHYRMFGVVLLPRRAGKLYVERIRRNDRGYWVVKIPTRRWVIRRLRHAGLTVEPLLAEGFDKLQQPQTIRHPSARRLAVAAHRAGAGFLLPRVAGAQHPSHTLLGRKPPYIA